MINDKKLKEVASRVKQYLQDGTIKTKGKPEYVDFFIKNADDSIDSCELLRVSLYAQPVASVVGLSYVIE